MWLGPRTSSSNLLCFESNVIERIHLAAGETAQFAALERPKHYLVCVELVSAGKLIYDSSLMVKSRSTALIRA